MDSKRQSVARGESRRYEANMVYLVSFLFATKKRNRSQPAEKSRPHHNKRYAIYESHRRLSCYPELASAYLCCVTGRKGNGLLV